MSTIVYSSIYLNEYLFAFSFVFYWAKRSTRKKFLNQTRSLKMSFNDKTEAITKEEWQSRLENFKFKQADMNKLIMNYLVTGKFHSLFVVCAVLYFLVVIRHRGLQRGRRKIPNRGRSWTVGRTKHTGQSHTDSRSRTEWPSARGNTFGQSTAPGALGQRSIFVLSFAAIAFNWIN